MTFSSVRINNASGNQSILTEAYKRLGYSINIVAYPPKRALEFSSRGKVDGELFRVEGIERQYPSLIRVPTAINIIEPRAYSITKDIKVEQWSDIKSYNIGIITGVKYLENATKGMQTHAVNHYKQLFGMLELGRVDIIICARYSCLNQEKENPQSRIKLIGKLPTIAIYHYLHERNRALVDPVNSKLMELQTEGFIARAQKESASNLLKKSKLYF